MPTRSTSAENAVNAMAAAKLFFETIPPAYAGKDHLGITLRSLDRLVMRLAEPSAQTDWSKSTF